MPALLTPLQDRLRRRLPRGFVLTVVILLLVAGAGFRLRAAKFGAANRALDEQFHYTPESARTFLATIGDEGRTLYVRTLLSLDLVFPVLFATLLAIPLARLYPRAGAQLLWLPVGIVLADWGENGLLASIASDPNAASDTRIVAASLLTKLKWGLIAAAGVAILVGFRRRARERSAATSGLA